MLQQLGMDRASSSSSSMTRPILVEADRLGIRVSDEELRRAHI